MRDVPSLAEILTLERVGDAAFTGPACNFGRPNAYGGLVIAQALAAGMLSVPERPPHSLHAYFLLPGDPTSPVTYSVDPVRDGRSFTTRRIQALQGDQIILAMMMSFQRPEPGLDYQDPMPSVPDPDDCPSAAELARRYIESLAANDPRRRVASTPGALFELRHVYPGGFFGSDSARRENRFWFRALQPLPDDAVIHHAALGYASDFGPMATSLLPHKKAPVDPDIRLTSIDHALWFHRPVRFDDWLLYDLETPSSQSGRGLSFGRIFTRDGRLVATAAQEGVMRRIAPAS